MAGLTSDRARATAPAATPKPKAAHTAAASCPLCQATPTGAAGSLPLVLRVCILGHSGVGKTHLARLFALEGWEPYRVRQPRSDHDAAVCMSPAAYDALRAERAGRRPLYSGGAPNDLRVYQDWSFFSVRNTKQCLEHTAASRDPSRPLRMELFAPVLAELLEHHEELDGRAFTLNIDNLVVLLLNPTAQSIHDMDEPTDELRLATLLSIRERAAVDDNDFDLADALRRSEHLDTELEAWKKVAKFVPHTVECLTWEHFEYRHIRRGERELARARTTVLDAVAAQAPGILDRLQSWMIPG